MKLDEVALNVFSALVAKEGLATPASAAEVAYLLAETFLAEKEKRTAPRTATVEPLRV